MNILDCAFQFTDIMTMGTVLQKPTHRLDALLGSYLLLMEVMPT